MNDESSPKTKRLASIDQRPGKLPRITSDGSSIAYALALSGMKERPQLVLRCDPAGHIWVSIRRFE